MTVYINTTPHHINLINPDTGEEFVVEKSRWLLNAAVEEKVVKTENGIQFVETVFSPSEEGWKMIAEIRAEHGENCVIVGSIIAAQAYKGAVVAMVAAPGFERVPPAEKKMNAKKITIFPAQTAPENAVQVNGDFLKSLFEAFRWAAYAYGVGQDSTSNIDTLVQRAHNSFSAQEIAELSFEFSRK